MIRLYITLCIGLLALFAMPHTAGAQSTSGVSSPIVKEGDKSLQYRLGIDPDTASGEAIFAQRLHYQQAINGDFRWRVVTQAQGEGLFDLNLDYVQAELLWELSDDDDRHKTGFRFDARIREGSRPEQFGAHWTNLFDLNDGWSARAGLYSVYQVGDNARDGVNLQTRFRLAKKLDNGIGLGVDMFNNYGNTGNIGGFKNQRHSIGPYIQIPVSKKLSVMAGSLFGVSEAARDTELRLWLTRKL